MRRRFYINVKKNYSPACRGFEHSGFNRFSSSQLTSFTATSEETYRYLFLCVLSCAVAIATLSNLSSAATTSPATPQSPAQLVFVELEDWNGDSRPHFNLGLLQGGQGQLSQYRGCILIMLFFATRCVSCRDEITSLQRLTEQLKRQAIAVLAIDVSDLDLRPKRYFETIPVGFPVLLDRDREIAKARDVYSLPMTLILDKSLSPNY